MKLKTLSEVITMVQEQPMHMKFSLDLARIFNCNDFGKQDLHPKFFIPWDMDNNCPMEEPEDYDKYDINHCHIYSMNTDNKPWAKRCFEYQQAKESILFDGFELIKSYESVQGNWVYEFNNNIYLDGKHWYLEYINIESIQQLENKVTLMPEVAKKLY